MIPELEGHPWPVGTRVYWTGFYLRNYKATVVRFKEVHGSGINYVIKPDDPDRGEVDAWHDEVERLNALELLAEL